ncbi:MAG: hypothetical protein J5501_08685 [Ruminococcus sp.]|nr:hypothetical protein [Ruminococcus sp.]
MYNDIKLEKALYNLSGKSFTAALEELDPSSAYAGTDLAGLDAFERQLRRFDIKVSGQGCDRVEKFFSSTGSAILFPEFVTRCIRRGFDETVLSSVCAVRTLSSESQYLGCTISDTDEYAPTYEGDLFPEAEIREGSAVVLRKFGRVISASYEAVRRQRLDVFGVMLRSVGARLADAVVKKAVTVLLANAEGITANELTYTELAALYGEFECFDMTSVIASPSNASIIAAMEQLRDTRADSDGRMILPFGSELIKTSAVPDDKIIGIDRDFALEFITSTDLVMETDKLIDRQLDQITVSLTCGFRKITPDAVKVLTIE